jgi:2-dehydro-3-deoxyphosphooctonate aldolase (KDO 8-P synthase)
MNRIYANSPLVREMQIDLLTESPPPFPPPKIILDDGTIIAVGEPLVAILGPCVIESEDHCLMMADAINTICMDVGINFVFKSSFDKANRSSLSSYRGPGLAKGLSILDKVKEKIGCPVLTDVHEAWQCEQVASVVDILQIPAFLCRQTDLLIAAAKTGNPVAVKKGQFVAPQDMKQVVDKIVQSGNTQIILTERGTTFGYNNLVVDYRSLLFMRQLGYPVCFDATHSTQLPGGGTQSGGHSQYAPALARAAAAVGIDVLFAEVHNNPPRALSDAACQLPIRGLEDMLQDVLSIHEIIRGEA